jgi:serine/threonine protein kinase
MSKVINPLTNRLISVNGPIFKKLINQGYVYKNGMLLKPIINLIDNIVLEASPNDLLSLYLTNKDFKNKLNGNVLKLLNQKYNITSTNFIQFFRNYNIKNISLQSHKTLYLYHLENTLYKPKPVTNDRVDIILWLYDIYIKLKLNHYVFGLAVTLFDSYSINTNKTALVCLYISNYILCEYADIKDYLKFKITKKEFITLQQHIISELHGHLIRPSTVFFTENKEYALLSYFSNDLLKYKPSLIGETINYIISGEYKIYTSTEISNPCKILKQLSNDQRFKNLVKKSDLSKKQCADKNKIIQDIIIHKPSLWHIGQYERLEIIGQGVQGLIYKIKHGDDYHVLKTVKDNLEPVSVEISIMKLLINPYIINMSGFKILTRKVNIYLEVGEFNLYDGILENKLPKTQFWKLIKNMVRAVDYCHYNDIIHRDLKPENVIYDGENLKLIDFGLSVPYSSFRDYLDPDLACTLNYRAPEALLGDTHYNNKIDIWALGLIIYFMYKKDNLFNAKPNIFEIFGTPTNWKEAYSMPKWKNTDTKKKKKITLGVYTEIFNMCTALNPKLRATTATLLSYIEYKI